MKHNFKIGDKVRIKPYDEVENHLGISEGRWAEYTDGEHEVRFVCDIFVDFKGIYFSFPIEALEPAYDKHELIVYSRGPETVAVEKVNGEVVKKAVAKCSPADEYKWETGRDLALKRLLEEEKPEEKPLYLLGHCGGVLEPEHMRDRNDLKQLQALPLDIKVLMSKQRIREWVSAFGEDGVYVSFSGGKDSTVLLHIVREIYPDVEAVFINTGLEYPEIQRFVKNFENVTILRPKMRFDEVIKKYGYPIISKEVSECVSQARKTLRRNDGTHTYRLKKLYGEIKSPGGFSDLSKWRPMLYMDSMASANCCEIMKKAPIKHYAKDVNKKPITAQMACESNIRTQKWMQHGCNGFDMKSPISNPMSFWTNQDILQYIKEDNLKICPVYGEIVEVGADGFEYESNLTGKPVGKLRTTGCDRTGCIFCGFGCHLEKGESRFERLKRTHPRQYEYCIQGGGYDADGLWKPSEKGLGMGHVFDELNKIYGKNFIRY